MPNDPQQQPDPIDKSLGDQSTGADVSRTERELSLGDQSTTGDALSSMSDLVDNLVEAIDSDLPLIDLAARYQIEGDLGQGGMGAVLLATDRQLKRQVAIKRILGTMAQSKTALRRFVTEAQSIAKLNHFNIVQVYEFGRDTEGPFLVLEYVAGGSLLERLKKGRLKIEDAVDLACQLCDALGKAHAAGIVHRDIKPANILLTEDGVPKLTDFGLARQETADHGQTQAGVLLGTIDFMPPEQRQDATSTDSRSDLWSLAATLYQMVTGKSPKIIKFRNVPQALQDVLEKALEDAPPDRYQTAGEFRAALQGSLAATAEPAPEVSLELKTGECAKCHTKNESSRKFCSECAAPLRVSCLACEVEIPVWEKVCGECGGKQPELIAARKNELTSLGQQIRDDVKDQRTEGLLEKTTRFLELNPRHEKVQKVQKQLLQKAISAAEKAAAEKVAAAAKLATSIKDALAKGDWQTVLRLDPNNSKALGLKASAPITNTLGMKLEKIPAGTFMMGSPVDETDRDDDEHQHEVTISKAFYMQTTEVTQAQWKAVMGTEPWKGQKFSKYVKEGANYPAMYVYWDDAIAFSKQLSVKEGKTYRLPTEAEWEYSCRAGTKTTWSFGNDEKALGDYAWYEKNAYSAGEQYAHQVGLKKPNAFGLYDMHGNVSEWCHDYYEEDYYKQSPEKNPTGPASGSFRVLRGGSWIFGLARFTRSAYRRRSVAVVRNLDFGFRLVRELD